MGTRMRTRRMLYDLSVRNSSLNFAFLDIESSSPVTRCDGVNVCCPLPMIWLNVDVVARVGVVLRQNHDSW